MLLSQFFISIMGVGLLAAQVLAQQPEILLPGPDGMFDCPYGHYGRCTLNQVLKIEDNEIDIEANKIAAERVGLLAAEVLGSQPDSMLPGPDGMYDCRYGHYGRCTLDQVLKIEANEIAAKTNEIAAEWLELQLVRLDLVRSPFTWMLLFFAILGAANFVTTIFALSSIVTEWLKKSDDDGDEGQEEEADDDKTTPVSYMISS